MKTAIRLLLEVVVLAAVIWFASRFLLGRSVPKLEGEVSADVSARVEVTFDDRGIPQVWAKTDADAWFTIGWLHASDRLFQMELVRRLSRGELSEVFGKAAVETDVMQRRLGFLRRADAGKLSPEGKRALERYVAGVNAWTAQARALPPEFVLLRIRPRPWTVEDCLAVAGYQTWFAHQLMDRDRTYQEIVAALGVPGSELTKAGHPWSPPTIPAPRNADEASRRGALMDDLLGVSRLRATAASNTWALAPSRSATGAAIHASDPHLSVDQAPGTWYLAGLHSEEGLNVLGATFAGSPFVVMGHNGTIAFSFTVAGVDLVDYYADAPVRARTETIRVKGEKAPRTVRIAEGRRGVMTGADTSLRWAGFDFPPAAIVDSAVKLQKARNFDDFRRAVTGFGALDANWVYSDRAGNIGYQLGAPVPLREFDTYLRQPATDARTAWKGYRRLEETPSAFNPAQGFLASCNNRMVPDGWSYEIPGFYDPYRIGRAAELLSQRRTVAGLEKMQLDLVSGIAMRWKKLAADGARASSLAAEAAAIDRWDGSMGAGSREAALFAFWWRGLARAVFEDELGKKWEQGKTLLDEALTIPAAAVDDRRTPAVETVVDLSARAMKEAHALAKGRTWGEVCTLRIQHPLSRVKLLDRFLGLSRGPLSGSGDAGSLKANFHSFDEKEGAFRTRVGPSMRFVLDWADVDAFRLTGTLGQSGNPFSEHYDDFLEMSERGQSWNVPFTREKVFAKKSSVLTLQPN